MTDHDKSIGQIVNQTIKALQEIERLCQAAEIFGVDMEDIERIKKEARKGLGHKDCN